MLEKTEMDNPEWTIQNGRSRMDNPETQTSLGTWHRRQKQHRKLKRWATRTPPKKPQKKTNFVESGIKQHYS